MGNVGSSLSLLPIAHPAPVGSESSFTRVISVLPCGANVVAISRIVQFEIETFVVFYGRVANDLYCHFLGFFPGKNSRSPVDSRKSHFVNAVPLSVW
jgi:hypothetical protein